MEQVILIGFKYDDFSDGGFEVIGVATSMEQAKRVAKKYNNNYLALVKKNPGAFRYGLKTKPPKLTYKTMTLNEPVAI